MNSKDSDIAIKLEGVCECFRVNFRIDGRDIFKNFKSLSGISFQVPRGHILGVIGENGSGKSTLLKLLAGALEPDGGVLTVNGSTACLLDVGAGLEPDFSGRENIANIAALMEPDENERQGLVERIVEFADLGDFIDVTVRQYSQGMQVRLGFAIAVFAQADVLLVDEVISVGDISFQNKSFRKITEYIRSNKTVVIASHDIPRIAPLCDSLILLSKGRIISSGNPQEVVDYYNQISGSKGAVGVCAAGDLRVVFNAGKLFVRYKGKTLTPYGGLTWVCDFFDYQEPSVDLEWGVESTGGSVLQVKGVSARTKGVCRVFVREFDDGNFNLSFDFDFSACRVECRRVEFSCILDPLMRHWAFLDRKGVVEEEITDQSVGKTLVAPHARHENPVCAAGCVEEDGAWLLFDSFASPQRLDYSLVGSDFKTLATKAVSHVLESHTRHCQFKTNLMVFDTHHNVDDFLHARKRNFSIGDGELKFYFSHNSVMMHAREREISIGNGLEVVFFSQDNAKWFDSDYAKWSLEQKGGQGVRVELDWDELGPFKVWLDFDYVPAHGVNLTLGVHNPEKLEICDMTLRLNLRTGLRGLRSGQETIDFSHLDCGFFPADLPFRDCRVGKLEFQGASGDHRLFMDFSGSGLTGVFTLEEFEARTKTACLNVVLQKIGNMVSGSPVIKGLFSIHEGACGPSDGDGAKVMQPQHSFGTDDLKCSFMAGGLRIFKQETECTAGMGLYSSVFDSRTKVWADSRQAQWNIEESTEGRLVCSGITGQRSLCQRWDFKLVDNALEWRVNAVGRCDVAGLDRMQFALMLGDGFKKWFCGSRQGSFEQVEFKDATRTWTQVYAGSDNLLGMRGTRKGAFWTSSVLPETVFERIDSVVPDVLCKVEKISGFWNAWALVFELDVEAITRLEKGQELFYGKIRLS